MTGNVYSGPLAQSKGNFYDRECIFRSSCSVKRQDLKLGMHILIRKYSQEVTSMTGNVYSDPLAQSRRKV
jgi:hypothetical protein